MLGGNVGSDRSLSLISEYASLVPASQPEAAHRAGTAEGIGLGRVVSVNGARCSVLLDSRSGPHAGPHGLRGVQMGALLAVMSERSTVLAMVLGLSVSSAGNNAGSNQEQLWLAELGLVGEVFTSPRGAPRFARGVTNYPSLGDQVRTVRKDELELAYLVNSEHSFRIGTILQDESIPVRVRTDELLSKHFAVLGTTGTGKSCTTTLLLRSILQDNPEAHILLLDPHNEYAAAFRDCAEVVNQRNMQLPYWLLTFEEFAEVVVGSDRRQETEILQELIPIAKNRFGRSPSQQGLRRLGPDLRSTLDTPVPYRIAEVVALLDERMGRLENKRDISALRNLKSRLESVIHDPRYAFMFGSLTVYDGMAQILGRLFRVPARGKPITIVELTGLPAEITTVVVSVLCRLTFDFALWSEGRVPVTLVCEEAHRYVPGEGGSVFEPCRRAIARIAKEGRKYGASLCVVTQRPAEIDPTILSQCSTVFAFRLSNDRDQQIVQSALSDTGAGLLQFLPTLGEREAITFGDGVSLPGRVKFDALPEEHRPRSASVRYSELWKRPVGDDCFLDMVVERWRNSSSTMSDGESCMSDFAASLDVPQFEPLPPPAPNPVEERMARSRAVGVERRQYGAMRRDPGLPPAGAPLEAPIQHDSIATMHTGGLLDGRDT